MSTELTQIINIATNQAASAYQEAKTWEHVAELAAAELEKQKAKT